MAGESSGFTLSSRVAWSISASENECCGKMRMKALKVDNLRGTGAYSPQNRWFNDYDSRNCRKRSNMTLDKIPPPLPPERTWWRPVMALLLLLLPWSLIVYYYITGVFFVAPLGAYAILPCMIAAAVLMFKKYRGRRAIDQRPVLSALVLAVGCLCLLPVLFVLLFILLRGFE